MLGVAEGFEKENVLTSVSPSLCFISVITVGICVELCFAL
jgi:hypothetical protein